MQPNNSDASTVALALLRSDGVCTFDLTMNGARLRPIRFGSRTAVPNKNGISIHLLGKLLAVAGLSARTANSSGVLSSSGFVIAVPSKKFWSMMVPSIRSAVGLRSFLVASFKFSTDLLV
jgi:hypothetical protein